MSACQHDGNVAHAAGCSLKDSSREQGLLIRRSRLVQAAGAQLRGTAFLARRQASEGGAAQSRCRPPTQAACQAAAAPTASAAAVTKARMIAARRAAAILSLIEATD